MYYKSYSDLSSDINKKLPLLIKEDFDLIVGIPRSGMIPAYMIAFNLNINCTSVDCLIANDIMSHGITRIPNKILKNAWDATKILLVDDSIKSGNSLVKVMERLPEHLRSKVTTLAIYAGESGSRKVDIFFEYLPWPRVFQWNIIHHTALPYYCFGIDGILCEEISHNIGESNEVYRQKILNANQLIVPNTKIHSLVTSRPEKFRAETEAWLKKHNVKYDHLVMLNKTGRVYSNTFDAGIRHKAAYYRNSDTILFIEKNPEEAYKIAKKSLKPVFCFTDNKLYLPDALDRLVKDPFYLPNEIKRLVKQFCSIFKRRKIGQTIKIENPVNMTKELIKSA